MNNIIKKENDYLTIEEVADLLDCSERTARDFVKEVSDIKEISTDGFIGHKKKIYNKQEILKIKDMQQQQQQLADLERQGTKLADNKDIKVIANAFQKHIEKADSKTIFESAMALMEIALNREYKKNEELENWKQERLYIENEKYKSKELRTKINKTIRKYCYNNNVNYSDFMIKLYRIYDNIHCFPFKENYKEYIDIIQERGHLKEFYNIVLNNI